MSDARRRRPSAAFLVCTGIILLLFVTIAIPNFRPARFDSSSEPLAVRVRVTDQRSQTPVVGAKVQVPGSHEEAVTTDSEGRCEAIAHFGATGILGRSGEHQLYGTIRVSAPGYQTSETSFVSLFGPRYDYFNRGTSVTCAVTLVKQ